MRRHRTRVLLIWVGLLALALMAIARARYTADLSAFLPRTPTPAQLLLVEQLRDGIASRLILIGVEGASADRRARASVGLARALRADSQFASVRNGEPTGVDRDRAFLFEHRYLLSNTVTPARFTAAGLHSAIQENLDVLASPIGLLAKQLLPRDPTGEMLQIIDQLSEGRQPSSAGGVWVSSDGRRALLVAETRAAGSDTDGQERAVNAVRAAFASVAGERSAPDLRLQLSGPGVFAVNARSSIKHEVAKLSILSTAAIMMLLLWVYRSFSALALGLVPVASGAIAGVAAVALGFDAVHGITLGFGVTLIGESVDYSIYLFIQSRLAAGSSPISPSNPALPAQASDPAARQRQWQRSLWPTIRLGVATSIAGFASLLPSGFPGLAQLGLFSISGLLAAALVTRFVLPELLPARLRIRDVTRLGEAIAGLLRRIRAASVITAVLALAAVTALFTHHGAIWNPELSALSPVSAADQALDAKLRGDLGAPDVRYLAIVSGADEQAVLRSTESLRAPLDRLVEAGVIGGYDSPAQFLPSTITQRDRQRSLPDPDTLRANLAAALDGLPLRIEKLEPFLTDVAAARSAPLLTHADLAGTAMASGLDALLLQHGQGWNAIVPLRIPASVEIDIARVRSAMAAVTLAPGLSAVVLDVKGEADRLYETYLAEVLRMSVGGLAAIVALLFISLRSASRVLRVVLPLALAVIVVAAGFVLSNHPMNLLHVIGMLLIVAVGSNYALFFDRRASEEHSAALPATLASLVIANAATVLGFGVLAFSKVPVLSALGSTVAPGAFLALVLSAVLTRPLPPAEFPPAAKAA